MIDFAGEAKTAHLAKRKICQTAFWMAYWERRERSAERAAELFRMVRALDLPNEAFFHLALRHHD